MSETEPPVPVEDDEVQPSVSPVFLPDFEARRPASRGVAPPRLTLELSEVSGGGGWGREVHEVDLEVRPGEIVALAGPPGSGKSTILRLIAGLESPRQGVIRGDGLDLKSAPPERRGFGVVMQERALFPHLDVRGNVAYGLGAGRHSPGAIHGRVKEALSGVRLAGYGRRRIQDLSPAERQRVALARALTVRPKVLLLDEPLSEADPHSRKAVRRELRELIRGLELSAIIATRDREEAVAVADTIAVVHEGWIRQTGSPEEIYRRPADLFVATFSGPTNVVRGEVRKGPGSRGLELQLPSKSRWAVRLDEGREIEIGQPLVAVVRPEDLAFAPGAARGTLSGTVSEVRFRGPLSEYRIELEDSSEVTVEAAPGGPDPGETVHLAVKPGVDIHLFPPRLEG